MGPAANLTTSRRPWPRAADSAGRSLTHHDDYNGNSPCCIASGWLPTERMSSGNESIFGSSSSP